MCGYRHLSRLPLVLIFSFLTGMGCGRQESGSVAPDSRVAKDDDSSLDRTLPTIELLKTGEARWLRPDESTVQVVVGIEYGRTVAIVNRSGGAISQLKISSGCSCSTATVDDSDLAEGETTYARFVVDTKGQRRAFSVQFQLTGRLSNAIALFAFNNFFDVGDAAVGEEFSWTESRDVSVDADWESDLVIDVVRQFRIGKEYRTEDLVVQTSSSQIVASIPKASRPDGVVDLQIRMQQLSPGVIAEWVMLTLQAKGQPGEMHLRKPIVGLVRPPFKVSPMFLHAGTATADSKDESRVTVERCGSHGLEPIIEVNGDWTLVGVDQEDGMCVARVKPIGSGRSGLVRGALLVKANEFVVTRVPLSVNIEMTDSGTLPPK